MGQAVQAIQRALPRARVVYCSATGATNPRSMGYMERLGVWGEQEAIKDFAKFLKSVGTNVGVQELLAMDMKSRGMYVCRTLGFQNAEFSSVRIPVEGPYRQCYDASARLWNELKIVFEAANEDCYDGDRAIAAYNQRDRAPRGASAPAASAASSGGTGRTGYPDEPAPKPTKKRDMRLFWGAHQRFFRALCMSAKVGKLLEIARGALEDGMAVVIGLQSTGDARTADYVGRKGEELDDFVSGPKESLLQTMNR